MSYLDRYIIPTYCSASTFFLGYQLLKIVINMQFYLRKHMKSKRTCFLSPLKVHLSHSDPAFHGKLRRWRVRNFSGSTAHATHSSMFGRTLTTGLFLLFGLPSGQQILSCLLDLWPLLLSAGCANLSSHTTWSAGRQCEGMSGF